MTAYSPLFGFWEGVQLDPAIANAWGTPLSLNFTLIEDAIAGLAQVNIAGLTTFTVTKANGAADNWKAAVIQFTGALTGNCTVTLPNVPRALGVVQNSTTGGFSVILTTGVGTTATIPPTGALFDFSIDSSGDVTLPTVGIGTLAVSGNSTITGNETVTGTQTVNGAAAFNSSLTIGPSGGLVLPFKGGALRTTSNNASIGFTTNGMVINLSNSGTANFQFQDATQSYTWSFGASGLPMLLTGGGNLAISGALTQGSDRRIKKDIEDIEPEAGTHWVKHSRPVSYMVMDRTHADWQWSAGFIAQEQIAAGFGSAFRLIRNGNMLADADSPAGHQYVGDAISRIAYLTAALQDALARIEALEARCPSAT